MPLRLRDFADAYPEAGWTHDGEHFVALAGGAEIGTITFHGDTPDALRRRWSMHRIAPAKDGIPRSGWHATREAAIEGLAAAWRAWIARADLAEIDGDPGHPDEAPR